MAQLINSNINQLRRNTNETQLTTFKQQKIKKMSFFLFLFLFFGLEPKIIVKIKTMKLRARKSKIAKLTKIDWRNISGVAVKQLFGDNEVSRLARVVRIPEHVLLTLRTQARRGPAWYYSRVLPSISATSCGCCCKSCTFNS